MVHTTNVSTKPRRKERRPFNHFYRDVTEALTASLNKITDRDGQLDQFECHVSALELVDANRPGFNVQGVA